METCSLMSTLRRENARSREVVDDSIGTQNTLPCRSGPCCHQGSLPRITGFPLQLAAPDKRRREGLGSSHSQVYSGKQNSQHVRSSRGLLPVDVEIPFRKGLFARLLHVPRLSRPLRVGGKVAWQM